MEKYHKNDVAPIERENERDENYEASNPQIDSERTRNNYRFTPHFGKTYTEFINGRIKELGLSPRKDAVVMNSFVLGSDKTFFDGLAKVERYNFFSDCYKFFPVFIVWIDNFLKLHARRFYNRNNIVGRKNKIANKYAVT